jgi:hypothetical protein
MNKPVDAIKIVELMGDKAALLLQDMFPIRDKYIAEQYLREGRPVRIVHTGTIIELQRTANRVVHLLKQGVKFTPTQPDVRRIEKMMLDELHREKELGTNLSAPKNTNDKPPLKERLEEAGKLSGHPAGKPPADKTPKL